MTQERHSLATTRDPEPPREVEAPSAAGWSGCFAIDFGLGLGRNFNFGHGREFGLGRGRDFSLGLRCYYGLTHGAGRIGVRLVGGSGDPLDGLDQRPEGGGVLVWQRRCRARLIFTRCTRKT